MSSLGCHGTYVDDYDESEGSPLGLDVYQTKELPRSLHLVNECDKG